MYQIKIGLNEDGEPILEVKTQTRSLARAVTLLFQENEIDCEVTEEVRPRVVKFKGV